MSELKKLEKEGKVIPISAMDKYGKTIEKSKKVIEEFPESRYVNKARLLMSKARYYRSDYDLAIANLKVIMNDVINPKVIIQPKSITGFIPLKINDKKAQIVVNPV